MHYRLIASLETQGQLVGARKSLISGEKKFGRKKSQERNLEEPWALLCVLDTFCPEFFSRPILDFFPNCPWAPRVV